MSSDKIIHLKPEDDFNQIVLKSSEAVIVDFYADWCGPCKKLTPILEERQNKFQNFKIVKVNVDEIPDLAEKYGVSGIPHVILVMNGKEVFSFTGMNEQQLDEMIKKIK